MPSDMDKLSYLHILLHRLHDSNFRACKSNNSKFWFKETALLSIPEDFLEPLLTLANNRQNYLWMAYRIPIFAWGLEVPHGHTWSSSFYGLPVDAAGLGRWTTSQIYVHSHCELCMFTLRDMHHKFHFLVYLWMLLKDGSTGKIWQEYVDDFYRFLPLLSNNCLPNSWRYQLYANRRRSTTLHRPWISMFQGWAYPYHAIRSSSWVDLMGTWNSFLLPL